MAATRPLALRWQHRLIRCLATSLLGLATGAASAGFVTTQESGMDAIFSQAGFGSSTVDIRFNPTVTIADNDLLSIDTEADFDALFGLATASPVVAIFYVDAISWCGNVNAGYIGCGSTPGNLIAVESSFAAGSNGANLLGHELGHNLGLDHINNGNNLMNPTLIAGFGNLNAGQITQILASPLVQISGGQRFITITPFAVIAETPPVPEPGTGVLMLLALGGLAWKLRRSGLAGQQPGH
jgi:hypothetical protein